VGVWINEVDVFLQKQTRPDKEQPGSKSYNFTLTDQWLGVQPANSYMAIYLRQWAKD
jgi:ATP adenylyltransferase/5',5'''-P-1,P-4-tetraphosphate phosphorylase II